MLTGEVRAASPQPDRQNEKIDQIDSMKSDPFGIRCGVLAIILAIAGVFFWPAGILGVLTISVSLFIAGLSGLFRSTILSTSSVIITTINSLLLMGEHLNLQERGFVGIPYIFAITCIIIGVIRNRAQSKDLQ